MYIRVSKTDYKNRLVFGLHLCELLYSQRIKEISYFLNVKGTIF